MSESNRMCGDSSLKLSNISRGGGADCHISNKINLSNTLNGGIETNGYNRNNRGGKNEEHDYKNQIIDLPKLLRQLSLARVVLKRLPISTEATKLRITEDQASVDVVVADQGMESNAPRNEHVPPSEYIDDDEEPHADSVAIGDTCDTVGDVEQKYISTTTCEGHKPADLIKRNCPKCKITVADASVCRKQSCAKCETPLDFQCARCAKQYNNYKSLCSHLNTICSTENLDLKCPKCNYRAASKVRMRRHQGYCLRGIIYNCKHCNFTTKHKSNLRRHLQNKHEDYDVKLPANSAGSGDDCGIAAETEENTLDKSTTTCNREKPADLIKHYCPRCKKFKAVASITIEQSCTTCGTPLDFQCARCGKQYSNYMSLNYHLDSKCNTQILDLKCSKCDYRTHLKNLMDLHKKHCLSEIIYNCNHCEFTTRKKRTLNGHLRRLHKDSVTNGNTSGIADDKEKDNMFITPQKKPNHAELIRRCCTKCKIIVLDASISREQSCIACGTSLNFQCARCDKQYSIYQSLFRHLDCQCNAPDLKLECPKCDYQTHAKILMSVHLNRCFSGVDFSCSLCEHTTRLKANLLVHMRNKHNDILKVGCSRCKTKSNKCGQCKNRVLICETCHTGFSSTDKFQEHQKSCKQPVLGCEYCPYKTHVNNELRKHIRLEHLSELMSQTLPLQA